MGKGKVRKLRGWGRSNVLAIGIVLVLGLVFRVAHLGEKAYWVDEVATSIRVAGYTQQQVTDELAKGRILSMANLQQYQQLSPARGWSDTLAALQRSPEHTPCYFLLARLWSEGFGSSVVAMRSLSVLLSLLALPGLWGLSWELFGSLRVATVAMGLMAVSPFFVAYAQEARPYSLWSLLLLVNGWLLLRAMRRNDRLSWVGYGVSAGLGLYTSLLSGLVLGGQAVYVALVERFQLNGVTRNYLLMLSGTIVTFIPWLIVILQQWSALQDNTTWMRDPLNPLSMAAIWVYSLVIIFFDVPVSTALNGATIAKIFTALAVLAVMVSALYWLCRHTPPRIWLLVLTLALPVPVVLMAIDLFLHGQASATSRYLMPFQLGIILAIAGLLGAKTAPDSARSQQKFWTGILVFLVAISLLSNLINLGRIPEYQKSRNRENAAIAAILNQADHPLLIANSEDAIDVLSLSHNLNATVQARIFSSDQFIPELVQSQLHSTHFNPCQPIFLLNPSEFLKQKIKQANGLSLKESYQPDLLMANDSYLSLWQLQALQISCASNPRTGS